MSQERELKRELFKVDRTELETDITDKFNKELLKQTWHLA